MAKTTASAKGTNRNLRDAGEEEHRHEHDADAQGRDQGRNGDFAGAFVDRAVEVRAQMQMALDILDGHRGVVDENADRQRQPAEGHDVDGLAQEIEDQRSKRGSTAGSRPR